MLKKIILKTFLLLILCESVAAQEIQGTFADWSVFTAKSGKQKICYAMSMPIKSAGNYYDRGQPYFLVVRSSDNVEEITVSSGYNYKESSEVYLSFGLKKFNIFTYKNLAWANDKNDDIDIVKAMRENLGVVVLGTNSQKKNSQDTYSLIGLGKALIKMKDICGEKLAKQ